MSGDEIFILILLALCGGFVVYASFHSRRAGGHASKAGSTAEPPQEQ